MDGARDAQRVTISDIDLPFPVLFRFLLKLTLAAIPVYLILMAVVLGAVMLIAALFGGGVRFGW